jgi:hypothetical protein
MNGAHAEPFSYALYHELQGSLVSARLAPLKLQGYQSVSGTEIEPHVLLSCDLPKCRLRLAIESTNGRFRISVTHAAGENVPQAAAIPRSQAGFTGPDQGLTRLSSRQDIQDVLQKLARSLACKPA